MNRMPMNRWYQLDKDEAPDSPALLVYPERVAENIRKMVALAGDPDKLRPHVKTHKTAEGIRMMMAAGIRNFKCATIAEAELLASEGAPDVLLAYQPLGPKLSRLIRLVQVYANTKFSCLVDHPEVANAISEACRQAAIVLPVYIDLNIGMNRTGIFPGPAAESLYLACSALPGIQPKGLHAYDGHHRQTDFQSRRQACNTAFEAVEALAARLQMQGHGKPVIIAGGSPTFPIHAERKDVVCSPGTCIFWDKGYGDLCPEQPFEPALMLLTRIVSLPTPTHVCLDLGHKSVASENEISRRVYFPDAENWKPVGQSEEHLVMEVGSDHSYKPGNLFFGVPFHVCPTVALHERMYCVEQGRLTGEWRVRARDRILSI